MALDSSFRGEGRKGNSCASRFARQPTGITLVVLSLADALAADPGACFAGVRLLFWHPAQRCAMTTDDRRLQPLSSFFPRLATAYAAAGMRPTANGSRIAKALRTSVPRRWRARFFPSDNSVTLFESWAKRQGLRLFPVRFAAGDCLLVPGAFWSGKYGQYAPYLAERANAAGVPVTALIYNVLPLSHPD